MAFLTGALEHSNSPHVRRSQYAELMGIHSRADARNWAQKQIKENPYDSSRMHAASSGDLADVFQRVLAKMANCRLPPHITPTMARGWFDTRNLISQRRMQTPQWSISSPFMDMGDLLPSLRFFWRLRKGIGTELAVVIYEHVEM